MNKAVSILAVVAALLFSSQAKAEDIYFTYSSAVLSPTYQDSCDSTLLINGGPTNAAYATVEPSSVSQTGKRCAFYNQYDNVVGSWNISKIADCSTGLPDPVTGECPPPLGCTAENIIFLTGGGLIPPQEFCDGACNHVNIGISFSSGEPIDNGLPIEEMGWMAWYQSTGSECSQLTPIDPGPWDGMNPVDECADTSIGSVCPSDQEPLPDTQPDCWTVAGPAGSVEICADNPNDECITVDGDLWCENPVPDCGMINGELVCLDPLDVPPMYPKGCFPDGPGGTMVCVDDPPVVEETTTTETVNNPDGSTTTTETTTGPDGVTITTTTTSADGTETTSVTTGSGAVEESIEYPDVPAEEPDKYSSMLEGIYDELVAGMGTDEVGEPGFTNPLEMPASSGCVQLPISIGPYQTTFPGPDGCSRFATLRGYIEWALYIITAMSVINIALARPV